MPVFNDAKRFLAVRALLCSFHVSPVYVVAGSSDAPNLDSPEV